MKSVVLIFCLLATVFFSAIGPSQAVAGVPSGGLVTPATTNTQLFPITPQGMPVSLGQASIETINGVRNVRFRLENPNSENLYSFTVAAYVVDISHRVWGVNRAYFNTPIVGNTFNVELHGATLAGLPNPFIFLVLEKVQTLDDQSRSVTALAVESAHNVSVTTLPVEITQYEVNLSDLELVFNGGGFVVKQKETPKATAPPTPCEIARQNAATECPNGLRFWDCKQQGDVLYTASACNK